MKEWTILFVNDYGYWGIFLLTLLESIVPIIPAEFILTLSGFATTFTQLTKTGVVIFASFGELLGSLVLYAIGNYFSHDKLENFSETKAAHLLGLNKEDIIKSREWFLKKGIYTVIFGRCIPVVGSLISVPAGMASMNLFLFIVFTAIGISCWNTILVTFGVTVKESLDLIIQSTSATSKILAFLFLAGIIFMIVYLLKRKFSVRAK